jgi:hypothetical protein
VCFDFLVFMAGIFAESVFSNVKSRSYLNSRMLEGFKQQYFLFNF